jgi:hypothetical protein
MLGLAIYNMSCTIIACWQLVLTQDSFPCLSSIFSSLLLHVIYSLLLFILWLSCLSIMGSCLGCDACNPLIEQLPPVNSWGKAFLITSLPANLSEGNQSCAQDPKFNVLGDVISVVAAQSGTRLSNNGQPFGPDNALDVGDVFTFPLPAVSSPLYLTANRPIQVMQYVEGAQARPRAGGDPSMTGELVCLYMRPAL